jgi:hypothetical protein
VRRYRREHGASSLESFRDGARILRKMIEIRLGR